MSGIGLEKSHFIGVGIIWILEIHFFFASDIAAFKALNTNFSINQRSLSEYLKKGYVPAPYSIFNEINQLLPGNLVEINFSNKNYFDIKNINGGYFQSN